jgi:glycerate kinase
MKILIAPNSMKGSLSAFRFADLVGQAFMDTAPSFFEIRKVPIADGGDYTYDILTEALGLNSFEVEVSNPLGRQVRALFGYANGIAMIEMANASGMKLLRPEEMNPLKASSYGTGQLILEAVRLGAKKIYIGVGGSATVDGGTGMLEALGVRFYDSSEELLKGNGLNLGSIVHIDRDHMILPCDLVIKIICDVENPLLGKNGASQVFAPQKGATPEMVELLEKGLENFAKVTRLLTGKSVATIKGSGAAGGVAAGMVAYLNAEIVPGADFVLDILSFDQHVKWADLVITGEGKIDNQTLWNKAPYVVAKRAKKYGKKVIGIAGSIELLEQTLFDGVFSVINQPCNLEYVIQNVDSLVYSAAKELASMIIAVKSQSLENI